MISELPGVRVPDSFSLLCRLSLSNTRISYGEITDVLQNDQFLNLYIKTAFKQYLTKGGMLGMMSALGWEGFRNRLAEAYIYHARHKKFPEEIIMDEVHDVIDIEKRFEFVTGEGNSRTFLFGFYLKLCDIYLERNQESTLDELITIPTSVDELLITGKSKGHNPDWLIIATWVLIDILGEKKVAEVFFQSKGQFDEIVKQLSSEEYNIFIKSLLKYGHGINDSEFILAVKV